MTVQTSTTVATGIGNGVTTNFPVGFKFNRDEDLFVILIDTATEAVEQLALNSDYTVQGAGREEGGSITTTFPVPAGKTIRTFRIVDLLQLTDLRNQGKFFAEIHEDTFDLIVMMIQQQQEQLDRAVKVPPSSDTPADELLAEFKRDVADAEQAARDSEGARDDSQLIADKFGNLDQAISVTKVMRDEASSSASAANSSAGSAASDAVRAEAARDVAFINADVKASIEAGLAGPEAVAVGEQFQVLSSDGMEYRRYRKDSETVAVEVGDGFPSHQRVALIDDHDRRYTANGRRIDLLDSVGVPVTMVSAIQIPTLFTKKPGGGLSGGSVVSSVIVVAPLPYYRSEEGADEFDFSFTAKEITESSGRLELGFGFGDETGMAVILYTSGGSVRVVDSENTQTARIVADGSSRAYTAGDEVRVKLSSSADLTTVTITPPSGVSETFEVPPSVLPYGQVWLAYRAFESSADINSLTVDGVSELALNQIAKAKEEMDVTRQIDLFPDPALTGVSRGTFWNGTVQVVDGGIVGHFLAGATNLFSWDLPATGALRPGSLITLECERKAAEAGNNASRNAILFFNSSGVEIGRFSDTRVNTADVWHKVDISGVVPDGTAKITVWLGAYTSETWQRPPKLRSDKATLNISGGGSSAAIIADRRVFVSSSGSDSNSGSESSPLQTLSAAALNEKVAGGGDIILMNGDYSVGLLDLTEIGQLGTITIQSYQGHRARVIRANPLTGITKTAGSAKVYQASLAAAPSVWVWQHDVPDARSLIALPERSAYQKGRQYRLPCTKIRQAASIAEIDSADDADPCWYWEAGTLYFSIYGGGDGGAADIRVPVGGGAIQSGSGSRFEAVGIDVMYGTIATPSALDALLYDVTAFGAVGSSITYNACARFESRYCEAAGATNDGFNSHNADDPNYRDSVGIHLGNWAHDNYGDGHSDHACSLVQFDGGLYEYNGKAGIVPANGSHAIARSSHARRNGLITPNGGGGFAITNSTSSFDPGVGTQFDLYGCVSEGNPYNYMCGPAIGQGGGSGGTTDPNHAMRVYNGLSRAATVAGYFARVGLMTASDCRDAGSMQAKQEQDGGLVVTENSSLLV